MTAALAVVAIGFASDLGLGYANRLDNDSRLPYKVIETADRNGAAMPFGDDSGFDVGSGGN